MTANLMKSPTLITLKSKPLGLWSYNESVHDVRKEKCFLKLSIVKPGGRLGQEVQIVKRPY